MKGLSAFSALFFLWLSVFSVNVSSAESPTAPSCQTSGTVVTRDSLSTSNDTYLQALAGTLVADGAAKPVKSAKFVNNLPIQVTLRFVDQQGRWLSWAETQANVPGGSQPYVGDCDAQFKGSLGPSFDNNFQQVASCASSSFQYAVAIDYNSGGLIGVLNSSSPSQTKDGVSTYEISSRSLRRANTLGMPPSPTEVAPVPSGSRLAVIGVSGSRTKMSELVIVHYQTWQKTSESQALAPREERTMQFTVSTGLQSSSSTLDVIAASLNTSVSAGWGPISTHISGSLSANSTKQVSTYFQQESTTFEEKKFKNPSSSSSIILYFWQLQDRYVGYVKNPTGGGRVPAWEISTLQAPQIVEHGYICGLELSPP